MTNDGSVSSLVATQVLARGSPEWVGPGLTGLFVIIALLLALVVLYRSMSKQLKRIRFQDDEHQPGEGDRPGDADQPGEGDRPDSDPPRASG